MTCFAGMAVSNGEVVVFDTGLVVYDARYLCALCRLMLYDSIHHLDVFVEHFTLVI